MAGTFINKSIFSPTDCEAVILYKANTEKWVAVFTVNFSAYLWYAKNHVKVQLCKEQIIALAEAGNTVSANSLHLNIPRSTVQDFIRIP